MMMVMMHYPDGQGGHSEQVSIKYIVMMMMMIRQGGNPERAKAASSDDDIEDADDVDSCMLMGKVDVEEKYSSQYDMMMTTMMMMMMMVMMVVIITKVVPWWAGWTSRTSYSSQYIRSAKLLHWNGRFKPWGRTSSFQDVWNRYFLPDPTKQFQPIRKGIM